MINNKPDIKADIRSEPDRGEDAVAMEPLLVSDSAPRREVLTKFTMG